MSPTRGGQAEGLCVTRAELSSVLSFGQYQHPHHIAMHVLQPVPAPCLPVRMHDRELQCCGSIHPSSTASIHVWCRMGKLCAPSWWSFLYFLSQLWLQTLLASAACAAWHNPREASYRYSTLLKHSWGKQPPALNAPCPFAASQVRAGLQG